MEIILVLLSSVVMLISGSTLASYASQSVIQIYSPSSLPGGIKFEDLLGPFWTRLSSYPPSYVNSWPQCWKDEVTIDHKQPVVFLGDLAMASKGNYNATHQNCQVPHGIPILLSIYDGECSTAEYPTESDAQLLKCAQDSNKVIQLMNVMIDGKDLSSNITKQSSSHRYNVTFNPLNIWDLKPPAIGTFHAMGESYYMMLGLPKGHHTIDVAVIRYDTPSATTENDKAHWDLAVN